MEDRIKKVLRQVLTTIQIRLPIKIEQVLTYVEAHDNHTLWDKLELTNPGDSDEVRTQIHKLSSSILLTSQGIPFYMQGKSLCGRNTVIIIVTNLRTQLTDGLVRRATFNNEVDYMKGLIELRKSTQLFE